MENEIVKDCNIVGKKFGFKRFEVSKKIEIIYEVFPPENNLVNFILILKSRINIMRFLDNYMKI